MNKIKFNEKQVKQGLEWTNLSMIILGSIGVLTSVFLVTSMNNPNGLDYFIATLFAIGSISGIVSVYYSNKKSHWGFALTGLIATVFKLSYPIMQIATGSTYVNYSVIIGQIMFLGIGTYQFLNWRNLNNATGNNEDVFKTKIFENPNTVINTILLGAIFMLIVSLAGGNSLKFAMLDTIGGTSFFFGVIFMAMGNIWAFAGFIISNITWMLWCINDFIQATDITMITLAVATLFQVITYTGLAITGWIEWGLNIE